MVLVSSWESAKALEKQLVLNGRHTMLLGWEENPVYAAQLLHRAGLITLLPKGVINLKQLSQLKQRIPNQFLMDADDPEQRELLLQ